MKKICIVIILLFATCVLYSQITLKPTIGLAHQPADTDSICDITVYHDPDMTFMSSGLQTGDTIPHFRLYTASVDSMDVLDILTTGKPLLLVSGSYTCPIFRGNIDTINNLQAAYGEDLNIFIVYVVEAHPDTPDICPYTGNVWVTDDNIAEGILYFQPVTYYDRKIIVSEMLNAVNIDVPVLLDGSCNAWWLNFGPAPNNAYLIKPDGTVAVKHGWFDKPPADMTHDIDSVLITLNIKENSNSIRGRLYPNPTTGTLNINIPEKQYCYFELTDINGSTVYKTLLKQPSNSLDLKELGPGIYFCRIFSGNSQAIMKKILIINY